MLTATDAAGKVRAVLFGYACHCTTLGGEFNKICAEWAGYACDEIEQQSPGAVALAIIGCGADANPEPRRNLDDAKQHGAAGGGRGQPPARRQVRPHPAARPDHRQDPPHRAPSRAGPRPRQARPSGQARRGSEGMLARPLIEMLDRGESIHTTVPYVVQTWCFGDDMAMVFLAGEVVVDYALRIKWETDASDSGSSPTAMTCPATSRRDGS